jgi:hypothetical protein
VDLAWKNVQPPLSPLPEFELEGLLGKLTAAGFDWPKPSVLSPSV